MTLCYPIETRALKEGEAGFVRSVTRNLSARGAWYRAFGGNGLREGQRVSIRVEVPHALRNGEREVRIDMQTDGWVRRVTRARTGEGAGEDGVPLLGVAVEFARPLEFRCNWL